jgi:hypothetical protein
MNSAPTLPRRLLAIALASGIATSALPLPAASPTQAPDSSDATAIVKALLDVLPALRNLSTTDPARREKLREAARKATELRDQLDRLKSASAGGEALSAAKSRELGENLNEVASLLESLQPDYRAWLTEVAESGQLPPTLAAKLSSDCIGTLPALRAEIAGRARILIETGQAPTQPLPSDLRAARNECMANIEHGLAILATSIAHLERAAAAARAEVRQLEAALAAEQDPEKKAEIEKQIEEKKAKLKELERQIEEKKEVRGKLDWGKVLSGIAGIAVGVALVVFSEGLGAQVGWGLIAGGIAMVMDGLDSKETVSEKKTVGTGERQRVLNPGHEPSAEAKAAVTDDYEAKGFTNISSGVSGNYVVLVSPGRDWIVLQVDPREVVATIKASEVTVPANDFDVSSLADLESITATAIADVSTRIQIAFAAAASGQPVSGGLLESSNVSDKFILSLAKP